MTIHYEPLKGVVSMTELNLETLDSGVREAIKRNPGAVELLREGLEQNLFNKIFSYKTTSEAFIKAIENPEILIRISEELGQEVLSYVFLTNQYDAFEAYWDLAVYEINNPLDGDKPSPTNFFTVVSEFNKVVSELNKVVGELICW
jgi:hypothetical protein